MLLAWLGTAIASLLLASIILWGCHEYQTRHEAGRIVKAIEAEDDTELIFLLVERTDLGAFAEIIELTVDHVIAVGFYAFIRVANRGEVVRKVAQTHHHAISFWRGSWSAA